jgi:hypothetical protein
VYSEYEPFAWAQNAGRPSKAFATFDAAMDEFYSKVENEALPSRMLSILGPDSRACCMQRTSM